MAILNTNITTTGSISPTIQTYYDRKMLKDMKPKQYFVVKSWSVSTSARNWSKMVGNKWAWGIRSVNKELRLYRIS